MLNESAWSTEKKWVLQRKGEYGPFIGMEHKLHGDESKLHKPMRGEVK